LQDAPVLRSRKFLAAVHHPKIDDEIPGLRSDIWPALDFAADEFLVDINRHESAGDYRRPTARTGGGIEPTGISFVRIARDHESPRCSRESARTLPTPRQSSPA